MKTWILPTILFVIITGFTLGSFFFYTQQEEAYHQQRSEQIADMIASNLRFAIQNRASLLKVLGSHESIQTLEIYQNVAQTITQEYPDFYAVNLVSPTGRIIDVHPSTPNVRALGQNLLERDDVKNYLIRSKELNSLQMSHQLITYQGVQAFTLYFPLVNKSGKFLGWLNGVVDFKVWLKNFITQKGLENARIQIIWNHPESPTVDEGASTVDLFYEFPYEILNQNINIKVGFGKDSLSYKRDQNYIFVVSLGLALLVLTLLSVFFVSISKFKLQKLNDNLSLKNNLLSSLSHDLSSPMSALQLHFETLSLDPNIKMPENKKSAIQKQIQVIIEMLKSVKLLHAQDLGVFEIQKVPVPVLELLKTTLDSLQEIAQKKNIQFIIKNVSKKAHVSADPALLKNNILLNVFTNSIKYSPTNSIVEVHGLQKDHHYYLIIEDQGSGLSPEQLKAAKSGKAIRTTAAQKGLEGTGLGLLQIFGLMKALGGQVKIENRSSGGCRITLIFKV